MFYLLKNEKEIVLTNNLELKALKNEKRRR
jgi:hypothetical protein